MAKPTRSSAPIGGNPDAALEGTDVGAASSVTEAAGAEPAADLTYETAVAAGRAAAEALFPAQPQDAARAAEDAAGSALNAPGVGSGPVGERFVDAAALGSAIEMDGRAVHRSPMGELWAVTLSGGVAVEVGVTAGVEPQVMSREGAFGAAPDRVGHALPTVAALLARRAALAVEIGDIAVTGAKLARPMPTTEAELDDLRDAGFDLVVISRQAGFRRAGVAHPTAPTLRRSQDFEVHEIEALARDPMLVVQALR